MKIKTQAYLLIVGVIVIPLFIFGMSAIIQQLDEKIDYYVPTYDEIRGVSGGTIEEDKWNSLRSHISKRLPDSNVVVLSADWRVLYSSLGAFAQGQNLLSSELLRYVTNKRTDFDFRYSVVPDSGGNVYVLMQFPHHSLGSIRPNTKRLIITIAAVLIALLSFYIVMVIIITRSIAISVVELEDATRRVVDGELDLSIEAKGSNEITSLKTSLNALRIAIKEERAKRARFIMGVTHDLKTPLSLVQGYVEALRDNIAASPQERNGYLEIIQKKSDVLEDLIDDLIDFLRVDTGEWRTTLKETTLAPVLTAFTRRVSEDAQLLNRRLDTDLRIPGEAKVLMDERLINRCLENLVNNALRYTEDGGLVTFTAEPAGRERPGMSWIIRIADDGSGIEEKDLDHVFELFYRGTNSRREQGNGLGLAIVKTILDSHGWAIDVVSKPGKGAAFTLAIP